MIRNARQHTTNGHSVERCQIMSHNLHTMGSLNSCHGNLTKRAWEESTVVALYVASVTCTGAAFTALRTTFHDCHSPQFDAQSAYAADAVGTGFAFLASIIGYGAATYGLVGRWRGWRLKSRSTYFIMGKHFDNYDLKISQFLNVYWPGQFSDYNDVVQFGNQMNTWLNDDSTCGSMLIDFWRAGEKVMGTRWDRGEVND
ncbi:hypothetical protein V1506DRAFT_562221 [Lipomyces tetrasporus]